MLASTLASGYATTTISTASSATAALATPSIPATTGDAMASAHRVQWGLRLRFTRRRACVVSH